MAYISEEQREQVLAAKMLEILPTINASKVQLGVSAAQYTAIANAFNGFNSQLAAAGAAKTAAKAATVQKNLSKEQARDLLMEWAKQWRANPAISDNLLALLQLPPHETPGTSGAPVTPTNLVAEPQGNGQVYLKWKKGASAPVGLFLVEFKKPNTNWKPLVAVRATKTTVTAVAGQEVSFRVSAIRDDVTSAPSTPVTVWQGQGNNTLSVAA